MLSSVARLSGHKGEVLCLDAPEGSGGSGSILASGSEDGTVRLWDLEAGRASRAILVPAAEADKAVNAVCLGTKGAGTHWVYAAAGLHIYGFDLRAPGMLLREPARRFGPSRDEVSSLTLHESGALAAADDAGDVLVYDASDAGDSRLLATLTGTHTSLCACARFRPTRPWELFSSGLDALCVRWDWRQATPMASWPLARLFAPDEQAQLLNPRHAHCLSFAPDGSAFALALGDGSLQVHRSETGEPIAAVDAHRAAASQVHFTPPLRAALVEQARQGLAAVASASSSTEAATALDAAAACEGLASGRALPLLSAGDDRQVRLWSVEGVTPHDGDRDGATRAKRQRASQGAEGGAAVGERMEEEEEEDGAGGEPGLRALASVTLREKPNWVAGVCDASSQRAVVCVATTSALVEVLRV